MIYLDRRGIEYKPGPDSVFRDRRGIFAVCIANSHILLTWPNCAPDVPELPGGGIDKGESESEALIREIYEETAVSVPSTKSSHVFNQTVGFYADDMEEFWNYDQIFWRIDDKICAPLFFSREITPVDALKAAWVHLDSLPGMTFHTMHRRALKHWGLVP